MRLGVLLVGVVAAGVAAEAAARWLEQPLLTDDDVWAAPSFDGSARLQPKREGLWRGAEWQTGPDGERVGLQPRDGDFVWMAGSADGAAGGISTEAHVASRLQRLLRSSLGLEEARVATWTERGSLAARASSLVQAVQRHRPSVVIVHVQPEDLGFDVRAFATGEPVAAPEAEGPLALLRMWTRRQRTNALQAKEQAVADLVGRDGLTPRAAEGARLRVIDVQKSFEQRVQSPTPNDIERARAWLALRHAPDVRDQARGHYQTAVALFDQLQRAGAKVCWLPTGVRSFLEPVAAAARELKVPRVDVPPFHLDASLCVDGRPSAAVHAAWADCILGTLAEEALLPAGVPEHDVLSRAGHLVRKMRGFHGRHVGYSRDMQRVISEASPVRLTGDDVSAPWVLGGWPSDGVLQPGRPVDVVLLRQPGSSGLEFRFVAPDVDVSGIDAQVRLGDADVVTAKIVADGTGGAAVRVPWPAGGAERRIVGVRLILSSQSQPPLRLEAVVPTASP